VLKGVDLDIAAGEFFALLGPSGSGKSTLLRLIAGFARHHSGELLIDGVDVSAKAPWERNVGMVFQSYALWPHLSVWDNVAFGLVERRTDKATLRQKVGAALELVGLSAYAQRRPNQLSGGQQQRVALARTIVIEPQLLLLDEPLSNLDKTLRVQMRQELLAMQRRLGLTTVFVTHDQEEAMTTADRMAVLDKGVVQQIGAPATLYDYPVNTFVAGFRRHHEPAAGARAQPAQRPADAGCGRRGRAELSEPSRRAGGRTVDGELQAAFAARGCG
jgi:iron(III) transport system ATP-binding protein